MCFAVDRDTGKLVGTSEPLPFSRPVQIAASHHVRASDLLNWICLKFHDPLRAPDLCHALLHLMLVH